MLEQHNRDPAIHNLLLTMYMKRVCPGGRRNTGLTHLWLQADDEALQAFLTTSDHYSREYALRLCIERGKTRASVLIYSRMGLYEGRGAVGLPPLFDRPTQRMP